MFTMAMPDSTHGLVECDELKNAVCCTRFPNYGTNESCFTSSKSCTFQTGPGVGQTMSLQYFNTDAWVNFSSVYSILTSCSAVFHTSPACAAAAFMQSYGYYTGLHIGKDLSRVPDVASKIYTLSDTNSCSNSNGPSLWIYRINIFSNFSGPVKCGMIYCLPSYPSLKGYDSKPGWGYCCMTIFPLEPSCVPYS